MTHEFDPSIPIERAPTPPSSWYTDPEVLERESETLFQRTWQFVARLDQVEEPGQFVSGRFLSVPWVLTRGEDGELRAFFNVCRHHAAEVASGSGCVESLTCPYHGWRYGLDGRLQSAPRLGAAQDFDRAAFGQSLHWKMSTFSFFIRSLVQASIFSATAFCVAPCTTPNSTTNQMMPNFMLLII